MGKSSREKGKRGERDLARLLRDAGIANARRGAQHRGGPDSPDVIGIPGTHSEVKVRGSMTVMRYAAQAKGEAPEDAIPIIWLKEDRGEWWAMVRAADLLDRDNGFAPRLAAVEGTPIHPREESSDASDG